MDVEFKLLDNQTRNKLPKWRRKKVMSRPQFLTKFKQSNPDKADHVRKTIEGDVDYTQEGRGKPFCFITYFTLNTVLPPLHLLVEEFRDLFIDAIVDRDMKDDLERSKVINWCRTAKPLFPIRTTADGNCLIHAVSLAVWGVEDENLFLRRLLYVSLVNDERQSFQRRWKLHQSSLNTNLPGFNIQFNTNEWEQEWENVKKAASDIVLQPGGGLQFSTLEAIHLYVLANILRRPILLLSDPNARTVFGQSIQENNLRGIYLPLEWTPQECCKTPVVIGYSMNHFAPLLGCEDGPDSRDINSVNVVPLVTNQMEPLVIHYLLADEEHRGMDIIKNYLNVEEIVLTVSDGVNVVLTAKLDKKLTPDGLNLMKDFREDCERKYGHWLNAQCGSMQQQGAVAPRQVPAATGTNLSIVTQETNIGNVTTSIGAVLNNAGGLGPDDSLLREGAAPFPPQTNCIRQGCTMFGSPATANMCSKCFNDYTVQFRREEEIKRQRELALVRNLLPEPTAPPPSVPPEASFVDLSIMGENCHNGCGLRCSTATYPYCHECKQKLEKQPQATPAVNVRQAQKCNSPNCYNQPARALNGFCESCYEKNVLGIGTGPSPQATVSPSLPSTPNTLNQLNSAKCSTPSCNSRANAGSNNKCARCYVQNIPSELPAAEANLLHSRLSSQTQLLNILPQTPSATTAGAGSGQSSPSSPGTPVLSSSGSSLAKKNLCSTPGCEGVRLIDEKYNGMCLNCYKSNQPARSVIPNTNEGGLELSAATSFCGMPVQESMTPVSFGKINPVITSSKQKVKCAGPTCKNLIYPPKKLCEVCTIILEQTHAQMSREQGSAAQANAQTHAAGGGRIKCKNSTCKYFGSEEHQGFCSKCYKEATKGQTSRSAPIRSIPPLSVVRSSTAPQMP